MESVKKLNQYKEKIMQQFIYFLTIFLCISFGFVSYFAGYVHGRTSEGKPIEIKSIIKKRKPPDPKVEAQVKEYNRQLYNIEHYTGGPDGMKRKGGGK